MTGGCVKGRSEKMPSCSYRLTVATAVVIGETFLTRTLNRPRRPRFYDEDDGSTTRTRFVERLEVHFAKPPALALPAVIGCRGVSRGCSFAQFEMPNPPSLPIDPKMCRASMGAENARHINMLADP